MPGFSFEWDVVGDVQLRRAFTNLGREFTDLRVPLRRFGDEVIYRETRRQFAAEGIPPWPRLSPQYAARKAKIAPGAKILHLTGGLEESLTDKSSPNAIYNLDRLQLEIGTAVMVGHYNLGLIQYRPERSGLPARRMMRLGPAEQTAGVFIFRDWSQERGRAEGIGV